MGRQSERSDRESVRQRERERGATPRRPPHWRGRFLLRAASRLPADAFVISASAYVEACQEGCHGKESCQVSRQGVRGAVTQCSELRRGASEARSVSVVPSCQQGSIRERERAA